MAVEARGLTPARVDLRTAAREVAPLLREEAEAAEQRRRLSDRAVTAMRDLGLYRLHLPTALGGFESEPLVQLEVIETLSQAHASA